MATWSLGKELSVQATTSNDFEDHYSRKSYRGLLRALETEKRTIKPPLIHGDR